MHRVRSLITTLGKTQSAKEILFDCGSTETRVWYNGAIVFQEPTCIAVHGTTGAVVAYGSRAVSLLGKVSTKFDVSFPIQAGEIVSPTLFQSYLSAVLKEITQSESIVAQLLGAPAWVVVPTDQSPVQETVLRTVFKKAGLRSIRLVTQATALLWELGNRGMQESFCVFSFGGQKSEFAIFALTELVAKMTFTWGGVHFTELVQEHIRQQHKCVVSWHMAEKVKREVCSLAWFSDQGARRIKSSKMAIRGKDVITQAGKTVVVATEDFTPVFGDLVEEVVDRMQFFFSTVPADLVAASLEQGIYLTGGVSAMAGLDRLIEATFTAPVRVSNKPALDAIRGLEKYYSYAKNSGS